MPVPSQWFCALLESAADVYFRYSLIPPRGFAYVSPSVRTLTGQAPEAFYADRDLCLTLVSGADRRELRRALRSRRGVTFALHLMREGIAIPVDVRTVALVKQRRVVAIEGVVRLAVASDDVRSGRARPNASTDRRSGLPNDAPNEPLQQRLAALMFEVHDLLQRVLPAASVERDASIAGPAEGTNTLRLGVLALDTDRLTVAESGRSVTLTPREVQVLRYLIERRGRVVTRPQLLTDVWGYTYTGDDRTVDVHISRLRRKLPSLHGRLVALRNIGYRLDEDAEVRIAKC